MQMDTPVERAIKYNAQNRTSGGPFQSRSLRRLIGESWLPLVLLDSLALLVSLVMLVSLV